MKLNTYLHFNGNCEAAFKFYQEKLGAKQVMLMHYSDAPPEMPSTPEMKTKVMHARLTLGDNVIMGSDAPNDRFTGQHGFSINIGVETPEEAEKYFKALSDKAEICMAMEETFWALRFGMLVDQFGVPWMVNCEKKR